MYDRQLVIFGATGDLCKRKLLPALHQLHHSGHLPSDLKIIGASRTEHTTESWLEAVGGEYSTDFVDRLEYCQCNLRDIDSIARLPRAEDMTFFLSVAPDHYRKAIKNLKATGLLDLPDTSRVVIEKPFGHDLISALDLQRTIEENLREKQVYRIDHYLGKDSVNNILATRFSNTLLEPLWSRQYIQEVQIFACETIGCEGRSQYYDGAGAVRDMLQNHLLQLVAFITMEPPCKNTAKEIRREKVKALSAVRLGEKFLAGQYLGYLDEDGVDAHSETPTFVAGDLYVDNWRWKGVPFYYMSGKKMPYQCVEIVVKLTNPPLSLFDGHVCQDRIVIRLQPNPHLDIRFDMKVPGLDDAVEAATLTHDYSNDAMDGYVRLLYDALHHDQSRFVHAEEVLESWRIVDQLLCVGASCPVRTVPYVYHQGNWGPTHKTELITHWDYPY